MKTNTALKIAENMSDNQMKVASILYSLEHMPKEERESLLNFSKTLKKLWNDYQNFKKQRSD